MTESVSTETTDEAVELLEQLAVRVESLNVWWYPIEDCKPYAGRMPTWMRGYMRSHKITRQRNTHER